MRYRYLSIVALFAIAVASHPADAQAAKASIEGTDGEAAACRPIKNICELQAIGATAASLKGSYCLIKDIDASLLHACKTGTSFRPIGSAAQPFTGKFDGKGFSIRNLSIVVPDAPQDAEIGLFGNIAEKAFVHDVGLIDARVSVKSNGSAGNFNVGGLAGTNNGAVFNAYVTGEASCELAQSGDETAWCYIGSLVGFNFGNLRDVFAAAVVHGSGSGTLATGGLVGANFGRMKRAYAIGPVTCWSPAGTEMCLSGGLIGGSRTAQPLSALFATGPVTMGGTEAVCGPGNGACVGGGLVGDHSNYPDPPVPLSQSFAAGPIFCVGEMRCHAGGFAGFFQDAIGTNSYATGRVSSRTTDGVFNAVGGFAGLTSPTDNRVMMLRSVFASGRVTCVSPSNPGACGAGGITGHTLGFVVAAPSAHWDIDTTKQTTNEGGGTGLTTQQLQSGLPAGFDPAVWAVSYGTSYPYLTVPNRWIPAVKSPTRTFPARVTSFWGSLALVETKQGPLAVFPVGQMFPWDYHAYDLRKVLASSRAASFAMIGRLVGSAKPAKRIIYADKKSEPLSLAKIDYFTDTAGKPVWPLSNPVLAADVQFFAGATPVADPTGAAPAAFNRQDILAQLDSGRMLMIQGGTGGSGKHWMVATKVMRNSNGDVTGLVANDPQLGQQVIIGMVQGSPGYRKVSEPPDYQSQSGLDFSLTHYFAVALN